MALWDRLRVAIIARLGPRLGSMYYRGIRPVLPTVIVRLSTGQPVRVSYLQERWARWWWPFEEGPSLVCHNKNKIEIEPVSVFQNLCSCPDCMTVMRTLTYHDIPIQEALVRTEAEILAFNIQHGKVHPRIQA